MQTLRNKPPNVAKAKRSSLLCVSSNFRDNSRVWVNFLSCRPDPSQSARLSHPLLYYAPHDPPTTQTWQVCEPQALYVLFFFRTLALPFFWNIPLNHHMGASSHPTHPKYYLVKGEVPSPSLSSLVLIFKFLCDINIVYECLCLFVFLFLSH